VSAVSNDAGQESEAMPSILIGTWIAIALPLVATVVALAFGAAYLITLAG
jgi:hypothetical protein